MAKKTVDEIMQAVGAALPDSTTDSALALLEDLRDTLADTASADAVRDEYESKLSAKETEWRNRYRDTFFGKTKAQDFEPEAPQKTTYDSLFKEK